MTVAASPNSLKKKPGRIARMFREPNAIWMREMRQSARLGRTPWILFALSLTISLLMCSIGGIAATDNASPASLGGITTQAGELGNTWNIVPIVGGTVDHEIMPGSRLRHSIVARIAQALPWNAVLKGYYRFYADDWAIVGHTFEAQLLQHIGKSLYAGFGWRHHTQTGASFFTTLADPSMTPRTADSDLAPLDSDSFTGRVGIDVPRGREGTLHFDVAYERYFRTNDLAANIFTCSTAILF
ncbi:MAG TPA: DUF3570 domain-containing protein [Polyangiaceae bacterium]|jgi:hypothetical protein|nr:DUF3570 domain-containing protein [Polyangiaceae bacterium]